jgi:hypothetical protein
MVPRLLSALGRLHLNLLLIGMLALASPVAIRGTLAAEDVFQSPEKTVFLRDNKNWLKSTAIDSGWTPAGELPASLRKVPADDNWHEVRASLLGGRYVPNAKPPVFVSLEPAELIQIQGEPVFAPVAGTSLFWVSNTESDLFR